MNYKKQVHYSSIIGHQNGEEKETWQLWECTDVLVKAVLTHMIVWYLSPHTPTTLECPLWRTCVSTQYFLNSYTFFSFWFIWWTGSRKLVIDMMPSLPCLTKTWSNHVHCQAGCSLGFFLWSGQLRIDFNKIQCWQQPWKKVWPWNLRKFPSCYFRWGSSHLDRISQG